MDEIPLAFLSAIILILGVSQIRPPTELSFISHRLTSINLRISLRTMINLTFHYRLPSQYNLFPSCYPGFHWEIASHCIIAKLKLTSEKKKRGKYQLKEEGNSLESKLNYCKDPQNCFEFYV